MKVVGARNTKQFRSTLFHTISCGPPDPDPNDFAEIPTAENPRKREQSRSTISKKESNTIMFIVKNNSYLAPALAQSHRPHRIVFHHRLCSLSSSSALALLHILLLFPFPPRVPCCPSAPPPPLPSPHPSHHPPAPSWVSFFCPPSFFSSFHSFSYLRSL